jgi:hypothetical protein
VQENFYLVFSIASSVTKILANKIVSLYSIFFSKIVYLYRFKRYIFEYRCPPLVPSHHRFFKNSSSELGNGSGAQESIPPASVAWLADKSNRARQTGNRFLG